MEDEVEVVDSRGCRGDIAFAHCPLEVATCAVHLTLTDDPSAYVVDTQFDASVPVH